MQRPTMLQRPCWHRIYPKPGLILLVFGVWECGSACPYPLLEWSNGSDSEHALTRWRAPNTKCMVRWRQRFELLFEHVHLGLTPHVSQESLAQLGLGTTIFSEKPTSTLICFTLGNVPTRE